MKSAELIPDTSITLTPEAKVVRVYACQCGRHTEGDCPRCEPREEIDMTDDVWGTVNRLERDKMMGNDPASLRAEIGRLTAERDALRAAAEAAKEFVSGMVKPAKAITAVTISGYNPCRALLDKINAALSISEREIDRSKT